MLDRVIPLFEDGGRFHGRYRLDPDSAPTEIHPGATWELPVFPAGSMSCDLMRIYAFDTTSAPLLQAHWRNETRALLRLSTRGLRSLPRFREAEFLGTVDLGYLIVTDSGPDVLAERETIERLHGDRREAFLRFFSIVEAIAAMHEEGLLHRGLTLQALRVSDEAGTIVVDNFQLSAFVAAWFRPSVAMPTVLAPTHAASRWMMAPERLAARDGQLVRSVETFAGDAFSLGMIGIALFVGLGEPAEEYTPVAHREWVEAQQASLRRAKLPILLERALEQMTAVDRSNRVASGVAAYELLASSFGAILHDLEWRSEEPERFYEMLYLKESIERIYGDGRGKSHPSAPDYAEYANLIEQDLVGGMMTWSPDGFEPWERVGNRVVARTAKVVLLGRAYAYFCAYLDSGRATEDRARLVVKHMLPMGRAGALRRSPRQRAAPRIVSGYFTASSGRRPPRTPGASAWSDIVSTVEYEGGRTFNDPVVATGRWLLDAQRADTRRAWYRVQATERGVNTIVLRDVGAPPADGTDQDGAFDLLWSQTQEQERMAMALRRLVDRAIDDVEPLAFYLKRDREDRNYVATLELTERELDPDTCAFRILTASTLLDGPFWLVPDDQRARTILRRQADALLDVEQRYGHLAAQIRSPRSVKIPMQGAVANAAPVAPRDENDPLLQQILETWPVFTVQGPPGTGKTWLCAELIRRALEDDVYGRFLISAQSHHALDNLLEGVARRLPSVAALRVASDSTLDRVGAGALRYTLREQLRGTLQGLASLDVASRSERLRPLIKDLKKRASNNDIELEADLARRLPRASSLVFTTSAQATQDALGTSRGAGSFDWVLVEEAARGWITDFFVPMVHGARWLLVGDHAQLPAHRQHEYEALLAIDIRDQVTSVATGIAPTDEWREYLNYFAHLMKTETGNAPRAKLRVQRRMHPDIAGLVANFYDGDLETHASAHRNHSLNPRPFAGTALVWLDTSGLGIEGHERGGDGLRNYCEAAVLKYFFRNSIGDVRPFDREVAPLVVLSPYRGQVKLLKERLGYDDSVVRTVDGFQGGEADVVLVSLVRNNASDVPDKAVGFLRDPSRVNVMFSRARRLLVIVGALRHFEEHGRGTFWDRVSCYLRADRRYVFDVAAHGFRYPESRP